MMKFYEVELHIKFQCEAYSEEQIKDQLSLGIANKLSEIFGYIPKKEIELSGIKEIEEPME